MTDVVQLSRESSRRGAASRRRRAAVVGTLCAVGLFLMFGCVERALVFPAGNGSDDNWDVAQFSFPVEEVWLTAADGVRVHGWWATPRRDDAPVILYLHGNSGNITHRAGRLEYIGRLGWGFLIIDYRGYGRSEGRPSEQGLYRDADAAWAYATGERGIAPERMAIFGVSLGTGVACELATRVEAGHVLLEAPFESISAMARKIFVLPIGFLLSTRFDNVGKVARIKSPLMVLHGDRDEVIPIKQGMAVYEAANHPKEFYHVPGGGHIDLPQVGGEEYVRRVSKFLGQKWPPEAE
jgi:fermentation-respiration switch protein FrsA (DUF1100 family)